MTGPIRPIGRLHPLLQNALDRIDWDHATQLDCYESQRYPV